MEALSLEGFKKKLHISFSLGLVVKVFSQRLDLISEAFSNINDFMILLFYILIAEYFISKHTLKSSIPEFIKIEKMFTFCFNEIPQVI